MEKLTDKERIDVLLEEYRVLYTLLVFRLDAMEKRLPVGGGALALLLGATTAMPEHTNLVFLSGLPAAFAMLLRSLVAHARAKEDHLRRIDEIERQVNQLAGEELLVFQSRHPNRRRRVSGRTGQATIQAVMTLALALTLACSVLLHQASVLVPPRAAYYHCYVAACLIFMVAHVFRLSRYRYERPPIQAPPLYEARRD